MLKILFYIDICETHAFEQSIFIHDIKHLGGAERGGALVKALINFILSIGLKLNEDERKLNLLLLWLQMGNRFIALDNLFDRYVLFHQLKHILSNHESIPALYNIFLFVQHIFFLAD